METGNSDVIDISIIDIYRHRCVTVLPTWIAAICWRKPEAGIRGCDGVGVTFFLAIPGQILQSTL
jgi:hypothetical protein